MVKAPEAPVLVTGACGNVGKYVVKALADAGKRVVATDLRTPPAEAQARGWSDVGAVEHRWCDLTDAAAVDVLVSDVRPVAVIHLAGLIPPVVYARPQLAWAVNRDACRHLTDAVAQHVPDARFVLSSSIGVHGSRNPHTTRPLTAETPARPRDVYGASKAAGEQVVRHSAVDWVVLRLAAVVFPDMPFKADKDQLFLEAVLPEDARVQTVDARDVARACVAAVDAACSGKILLIGGDESHRITQGRLSRNLAAALGVPGSIPRGVPGDPADDNSWFVVDWVDTTEAQALLDFQRHTWADTRADISRRVRLIRPLLLPWVPLVRFVLWFRSPRHGHREEHLDPWSYIERRWGPAALDVTPPSTA